MATQLVLPPEEEAGTDIVALVAADHSVVLFDEAKFDAWLRAKRDNAPTGLDMAKARDRATIASYADRLRTDRADIRRDKLKLTENWREQTKLVNEAGSKIDAKIAAMIDDILAPVTAWKDAEKARETRCLAIIAGFRADTLITDDDTSATVKARGLAIYETVITTGEFGSLFDEAVGAKDHAVATLSAAMKRLHKAEQEAIELEALRAEKAERDRLDEDARLAEEARLADLAAAEEGQRQEQARLDQLEADRVAEAERAETARLAELERVRLAEIAAADAAREEERITAQALRDEESAAAQALIDAANERVRLTEEVAENARLEREAADAERDRLALVAEQAAAEAAKIEAARVANVRHRTSVKAGIERALMERGADDATAHKIASDAIAGLIANLAVVF